MNITQLEFIKIRLPWYTIHIHLSRSWTWSVAILYARIFHDNVGPTRCGLTVWRSWPMGRYDTSQEDRPLILWAHILPYYFLCFLLRCSIVKVNVQCAFIFILIWFIHDQYSCSFKLVFHVVLIYYCRNLRKAPHYSD